MASIDNKESIDSNSDKFESEIMSQNSLDNQSGEIMNNEIENDEKQFISGLLEWKDEIGYLGGSWCTFKRDSDGRIILREDELIEQKQKFMAKNVGTENFFNDQISCCFNCKKNFFKEDLSRKGKYCKDCASLNPILLKIFKNKSFKLSKVTKNVLSNPISNSVSSTIINKKFLWDDYLKSDDTFIAAPIKSFWPCQLIPTRENNFKVGMKMEGIDPLYSSRFYILSVVDIQGSRLRMHFDGYKNSHDFWINFDSEFIFPIGFCKRTNRTLSSPAEIVSNSTLLQSKAAPDHLFTVTKQELDKKQLVESLGFKVNLKLEAVDRANDSLVCVSTIVDILNDYLLIHFDGWDDSFDYWTHIYSPVIHPINWCKSKGNVLTPPNNYKFDHSKFSWEQYLSETGSQPVPQKAFKSKQSISWKTGMKLEAVDIRNPKLIRVASIVSRRASSIRIHYDGWNSDYDTMFDYNSPDLHPINYCLQTNHELQPPPNKEIIQFSSSCPVACCNGLGHIEWYNYCRHSTEDDCPYYDANLDNSDRDDDHDNRPLIRENDDAILSEKDLSKKEMLRATNESCNHADAHQQNLNIKFILNDSLKEIDNFQYTDDLQELPKDILNCDRQQIEQFVRSLTNSQDISDLFFKNFIDGQSFLMLTKDDLLDVLKIKMGPAIKIYYHIVALKYCLAQTKMPSPSL